MSRKIPVIDFDAEARALWERLNLDPESRTTGQWNALDSIFRHPTGGGIIYVGNQTAAESLTMLRYTILHNYYFRLRIYFLVNNGINLL
jgi:hypothetical protein